MFQIRRAAHGKFHYALEIDSDNNQKLLGEHADPEELKKAYKLPADTPIVNEEDTIGTIEPPEQPEAA